MRSYRGLPSGSLMLTILLAIPLSSGQGQVIQGPSPCVEDVYPDLCPVKDKLYETYLWYNGGATYLRFTNAIANLGPWELFFDPAGPVDPQTGKRPARQRVGCVKPWGDTLTRHYPAGEFEYHGAECHGHIHLGKIARYSIRAYSGTTEPPGTTLAVGEKVGFCLVDGVPYQEDACCGPVQGAAPQQPVFCLW